MKKAIIILVNTGYDGKGDFLFGLKLARELKDQFKQEAPPIFVVRQDEGFKNIVNLKGHSEFKILLLSMDDLKKNIAQKKIQVGCFIEGPVFIHSELRNIDKILPQGARIPLLLLPEYGYNSVRERETIAKYISECKGFTRIKYPKIIYPGFNDAQQERGILLSHDLVHQPPQKYLADQIEPSVHEAIFKNRALGDYQAQTQLFMQYSHDTYVGNIAQQYLRVHREFILGSNKNQDVLLIGPAENTKKEALAAIKDRLIADRFTRISFLNGQTKQEQVIYTDNSSNNPNKTYRVIYFPKIVHESMISCVALSGLLIGATGDQSLGEAVSANKIILYEALGHKLELIKNHDAALIKASQQNVQVIETLGLLRKQCSDSEYARLGQLLRTVQLQQSFVNATKQLVVNYNFADAVMREGLLRDPEAVIQLINQNKQPEALKRMYEGGLNIFTPVAGICLIYYALEKEPAGVFASFANNTAALGIELVETNNIQGALEFMRRHQISPFIAKPANGKSILAVALDNKDYQLVDILLLQANTNKDKKAIATILQSQSPEQQTYLLQLQKEHTSPRSPMLQRANYFSALVSFHKELSTSKEPQSLLMHHTLRDFLAAYNTPNRNINEDEVFIALLLLNRKSMLATTTNTSSGSLLVVEKALNNLGVNPKTLSVMHEKKYFEVLQKAIQTQPEYLANKFVIDAFNKYSQCPPLKITPQLSSLEWLQIVRQNTPPPKNTLLKIAGEVYLVEPNHDEGYCGTIHRAQHCQLGDRGKIIIAPTLIAKKMSKEQAKVLDKEFSMLKAADPNVLYRRQDTSDACYILMPEKEGVQLERYLTANPTLKSQERLLMANSLLQNLNLIHQRGINHNDLKKSNIIYDPVMHNMQIIDFGCAEKAETLMKYTDIESSVFAFEMPPEYLSGAKANPAMDVFAATSLVAEILGADKQRLVIARLKEAFKIVNDPQLEKDIIKEFMAGKNLGNVFFTPTIKKHNKANVEKFIQAYVHTSYNFSAYKQEWGTEIIDMLSSMQDVNPKNRPSLEQCQKTLQKQIDPELRFDFMPTENLSAHGFSKIDNKADYPPQSYLYNKMGESLSAPYVGATASAGTTPSAKELALYAKVEKPLNPYSAAAAAGAGAEATAATGATPSAKELALYAKVEKPPSPNGAAAGAGARTSAEATATSTASFKAKLASLKTQKPPTITETPQPPNPGTNLGPN